MKAKILLLLLAGTATLSMAEGSVEFQRCAVCHGEHAEKKSLGVSAVIAGWEENKIVEKLKAYKSGKLNQYGYGSMMGGQATKLNDTQMREIARYVSKLVPQVTITDTNSTDEVLTPEQIAYKIFLKDYFNANPQYGTIRKANQLWEAEKKKQNSHP